MSKKLTRKSLDKYFKELESAENIFSMLINEIEQRMAKETGVKDIQFFFCNGYCAGMGNASKTMKLIHR